MKTIIKYFFTLIILSSFNVVLKAQTWVALSSPSTAQDLLAVFFLNKDTGFIGGGSSTSGLLFKTQNGGNTWTSITVPTAYPIMKICFLTNDSGYICTQNTQLYKTTNGGSSWSYIRNFGYYGTSLVNSPQIFFQNSSVGFIRGANYIWRTLNGGTSWDSTNIAPTGSAFSNWYEINFISPAIGYTSNIPSSIWKTTNQGISWSLSSTPITWFADQIFDFKFFNTNLGIVIGGSPGSGYILRTNNGGTSWTSPSFSGSSYIGPGNKISFTSNNKVFIFLSGYIYSSNDTGNTWSQMTVGPTTSFFDWFMVNDSIGYAVGGSSIYKTYPGALYVSPPTTAASTFFIGNITNTSMQLNWTSGNGSSRIVVACAGSNTLINPSYGVSYTASSFGSGSQIGTGNYVVYNGTGNSCTVSGLSLNTAYYFRVYEYNGTGTNTNYLTSSYATGGAMTLPVKLISFTAKEENNVVNLNWQTASEINNDYFEIERSEVGSQKLEDWKSIGSVKGNGTTNSVSNYQFIDASTPLSMTTLSTNQPINIYYRLKQVDYDGNFEYSKVVSVLLNKTNKNEIIISPNPTSNNLNIQTTLNENYTAQLFDITGKLVYQNSFIQNLTFNIYNYQQGIYFLIVTDENNNRVATKKVAVMR